MDFRESPEREPPGRRRMEARRSRRSLSPERPSRRGRRDRRSRSPDVYREGRRSRRSRSRSSPDSRRSRKRRRSRRRDDRRRDDSHHRRNRRRRNRRPRSESFSSAATEGTPRKQAAGVVSEEEDDTRRWATQQQQQPRTRSASSRDDTVGHFRGGNGTVVADRFRIVGEVGLGTFGRVVECLDLQRRHQRSRDAYVALKIVRDVKRYYDSAVIEANIVSDVNRRGGRGRTHCVVMHDAFSFDGHYCMVFESLGPSLYDFLKRHNYQPFPMACVQDFAVQLLETLEFLHSFRLIHTDLKIENILLMNNREVNYGNQRVPESTKIKLIDFGGACYDSEKKSSVINTRQYRAPEVILGVGWSMPSDIWSLGCILAELYQGELLFATHDNIEHLALIERVIGNFPRAMVKAAKNGSQSDIAQRAFDSNGRHRLDRVLPSESASFVRKACLLDHLVRNPEDSWFLGLLRKMLMIDPNERSTAHECLQYLSRIRRDVVRYN